MSHKFARPQWSNATGQRDRALPVHVRILKIFSEGGEGPAFRPGWVQIKTLENRRGSGPPLPTPSGSAHDAGDNISNQMTTGVMVKKSIRNIAICRVHMHNLHPGANLHSDTNLHPLVHMSIHVCT